MLWIDTDLITSGPFSHCPHRLHPAMLSCLYLCCYYWFGVIKGVIEPLPLSAVTGEQQGKYSMSPLQMGPSEPSLTFSLKWWKYILTSSYLSLIYASYPGMSLQSLLLSEEIRNALLSQRSTVWTELAFIISHAITPSLWFMLNLSVGGHQDQKCPLPVSSRAFLAVITRTSDIQRVVPDYHQQQLLGACQKLRPHRGHTKSASEDGTQEFLRC